MTAPSVPAATGWNTWDVQYHTGWTHLPSGLRIRFGLRSGEGRTFDGFTWRHGLLRLGHHTVDGRYAVVAVTAHQTTLRIEASGGGDELALLATRTPDGKAAAAGLVLLIDEAPRHDGRPVIIDAGEGGDIVVIHGETRWHLHCSPAPAALDGTTGCLRFDTESTTTIRLHPDPARSTPSDAAHGTGPARPARVDAAPEATLDVRRQLAEAAAAADAVRLRTAGWLGDSADALTRALTWNTIYAPDLGRVITPTSRDFVCHQRDGFYGRWALHTWDTFFTGLVASLVDPAYSESIFGQILEHADAAGMLPNRVSDDKGRTDDRSQPPVGAYTVLKAYLASGLCAQTRRAGLLRRTYPALAAWHAWWPAARTGPHGILAWGSDPVPGDTESATVDRAKRESGLDDSPMYDETVLDPTTHTMNLTDVGLNALHVADAEALATIAAQLGDAAAADRYARDARRAADRADNVLWDPTAALYRNRWAGGDFSGHASPTLLYPLLSGLPDSARARTIARTLLTADALGGDPPLPSTARNDPGFSTRYWRGRVWAPMAFLAVEGLRRYGLQADSRPIVDALLRLFLREWAEHSHVRENYPVVAGEDVRPLAARSDGLMGWGGLLGYLAIQELADPRPDGWRFAHPGRDATVDGLPLAEGRLGVRAADRLVVSLDGRPLLDMPSGVTVTGYERRADAVRGVLNGVRTSEDRVLVAVPPATGDRPQITVRIGDTVHRLRVEAGLVRLVAPGDEATTFEVQSA